VEQRRRLKAIKKNVIQKLNVILFFDTEILKYFLRVLHEAKWLVVKILTRTYGTTVYVVFERVTFYNFRLTSFLIIIASGVAYLFVVLSMEENSQLATYFTIPIFGSVFPIFV
jgi:hypothetical protein